MMKSGSDLGEVDTHLTEDLPKSEELLESILEDMLVITNQLLFHLSLK